MRTMMRYIVKSLCVFVLLAFANAGLAETIVCDIKLGFEEANLPKGWLCRVPVSHR